MANTSGYEIVAEITPEVAHQILLGAWDNSIIPHSVDVASGTGFGPYQLADGVVNIPREGLALELAPVDNALRIRLGAEIQVEVANPPVPSATYFGLTADIAVTAPLGTLDSTINVGVILAGLPRERVTATVTSGDPIGPITLELIREYVHARYEDGTIPHTVTELGVSFGGFTADAFLEIFDDPSDPNHQIAVLEPAPGQVKLLIPVHLRLSNVAAPAGSPQPLSPMGVEAKLALTCPLETGAGFVRARLSTATTDVEDLEPAPGPEGTNYVTNRAGASLLGIDLDAVLKTHLRSRAETIAHNTGDVQVEVPTLAQIEAFIGDQVHLALLARGNIPIWTPQTPDSAVTVNDVTPKVLADAIAMALNAGASADPNGITNMIPAGRSCAIVISGEKVLQIIDETIHRPESEGGFGPEFPPRTFHDVDGHDVVLTSLRISLRDGSIRLEGDVTVVDAVCGADVDASFTADVGLEWVNNADGTQTLRPFVIGEPDVDLSAWAWLISLLVGFILGGLIGGIVVAVVLSLVDDLAERIGSVVIRDEVTGQIRTLGAWPQQLQGIGTVTTRFENPVDIDPDGIIFPDAFTVTAFYASTVVAPAQANGPYAAPAGVPVTFQGGPPAPSTSYHWDFGDGATATGMTTTHAYANDGTYVAKLTTVVAQPGGTRSRQFALVRVHNVPPKVDLGPPVTIREGEEIELVATFTDDEWPDKHEAVFDFGDDSLPVQGSISETNQPPRAQGTARARHAYCDNGDYVVTVKVRDEDGGVGIATKAVKVLNVAPVVEAGEDFYAYPCTPVTLIASFVDPGWCDTHTGTWDFGDCTPPQPAVIHERHQAPAAVGIAAATHVYHRCGTYLARATVADDDGGVGVDTTVVRVVSVRNAGFEEGFRSRLAGIVANEWEPYVSLASKPGVLSTAATAASVQFDAEEFIVHEGQRSQRIAGQGAFRGGLWQQLGANPGWDYQVSVWYHLAETSEGVCRLGLDPEGGTDPDAPSVVWQAGVHRGSWRQLVVRVTSRARAVTIFLEASGQRGAVAYFDEVKLVVTPCPLRVELPEPQPPEREEKCVDWKQERKPRRLEPEETWKGFQFRSASGRPLEIVVWGEPAGDGKLRLQAKGLRVELPFEADTVTVELGVYAPLRVASYDTSGARLAQELAVPGQQRLQTLTLRSPGQVALEFTGGGEESYLVRLCAAREKTTVTLARPRGTPQTASQAVKQNCSKYGILNPTAPEEA